MPLYRSAHGPYMRKGGQIARNPETRNGLNPHFFARALAHFARNAPSDAGLAAPICLKTAKVCHFVVSKRGGYTDDPKRSTGLRGAFTGLRGTSSTFLDMGGQWWAKNRPKTGPKRTPRRTPKQPPKQPRKRTRKRTPEQAQEGAPKGARAGLAWGDGGRRGADRPGKSDS